MREMPRYKCHKEVHALKIGNVVYDRPPLDGVPQGGATLTPADCRYGAFAVSEEWAAKHRPQVGGYYVVYEDGYASFSPAAAFEGGYALL